LNLEILNELSPSLDVWRIPRQEAPGEQNPAPSSGVLLKKKAPPFWLKFKNPEAPAVTREAEEEWGR
jgi:hypothetical protein